MDKQWVMGVLEHLSTLGRTASGGSCRLGFTEADAQARDYFMGLMRESGLSVRVDPFGNIIGRLGEMSGPAVASGSHLDTVPEGGHYDGMVGCVAALAAIRRLKERGPLARPLELIVFQLEESSRFAMATMGSKVMAGTADLAKFQVAKDNDGVTLPEAMRGFGLDFAKLPQAVRSKGELAAFVELHIDQSQTLEDLQLPVGIVSAIAAPIRSRVTVEGWAAHSGSTPMNKRRDAVLSAAELIVAVRAVGNRFAIQEIVTTVGKVTAFPGSMNVVAGKAELLLDLRGTDKAVMEEAFAAIRAAADGIAAVYGTPIHFDILGSETPVRMDPRIQSAIEDACTALKLPARRVVSGAGHDAMNVAAFAPVGMIFVRCRGGISHNPAEFAEADDIMAGLDILTETLYNLAK